MLERIRQLDRRAGQFVFIAVLLDWSKFSYSPGVPPVFRRHPSRSRGTKRHPLQSFLLARRIAGHPRAGSTCAIEDSSPRQSSRWAPSRRHRAAVCWPAAPLYRGEGSSPHRQPPFGGQQAIRTDRALTPLLLAPPEARRLLRVRQALRVSWLRPSLWAWRQAWRPLEQLALRACSPPASPLAAWPWLP